MELNSFNKQRAWSKGLGTCYSQPTLKLLGDKIHWLLSVGPLVQVITPPFFSPPVRRISTPQCVHFKTPPCVRATRLHVEHMWACFRHTCGRFECTHLGVLNLHAVGFSACQTAPRTTPHHTKTAKHNTLQNKKRTFITHARSTHTHRETHTHTCAAPQTHHTHHTHHAHNTHTTHHEHTYQQKKHYTPGTHTRTRTFNARTHHTPRRSKIVPRRGIRWTTERFKSLLLTLYSLLFTLYSLRFTLYSLLFTLYSLPHLPLYSFTLLLFYFLTFFLFFDFFLNFFYFFTFI